MIEKLPTLKKENKKLEFFGKKKNYQQGEEKEKSNRRFLYTNQAIAFVKTAQ